MRTPADPRPFVHAVVAGVPLPFKRRAAQIVPTARLPVLLARARRARTMGDLMALFNARTAPRDTAAHKQWRKTLEWQLRKAGQAALGQRPIVPKGAPIEVWIKIVAPMPRSRWLKTSLRPRQWDTRASAGDWENLGKPVCDAANGILWHDDSQVVRGTLEKIVGCQGEPPRLEILARAVSSEPGALFFDEVLAAAMEAVGESPDPGGTPWPEPRSLPSLPLQVETNPAPSRTSWRSCRAPSSRSSRPLRPSTSEI